VRDVFEQDPAAKAGGAQRVAIIISRTRLDIVVADKRAKLEIMVPP
jgi:hypothetical protein